MRHSAFLFAVLTLGTFLTEAFLPLSGLPLLAQLPPTLNRISKFDSAIDPPLQWQDGRTLPILLKGDELLETPPLIIEASVEALLADGFNIFAAYEPKSSPRHWELYSMAGSGQAAFYVPGNSVPNVVGGPNLADGKAHSVRVAWAPTEIQLFVDEKSVAKAPYDRKAPPTNAKTQLALGSLAEGNLSCHGALKKVRIEKNSELLLECAWASPAELKTPLLGLLPSKNPEDAALASAATLQKAREAHLFPKGGVEIEVPEGWKPPKGIPTEPFSAEELTAAAQKLHLQNVSGDAVRPGVLANWGEHFCDLKHYLNGKNEMDLPVPSRGAKEQVWDPQALILKTETHPAQIVCRRTFALLEWLEEKQNEIAKRTESASQTGNQPADPSSDLERMKEKIRKQAAFLASIRSDLEKCRQSVEQEPKTETFFAICALRRQLMFAAPEVKKMGTPDSQNEISGSETFDGGILFCARASYAGSRLTNRFNSDRTGGHFATQVYGFNTIHGGGLFVIRNWKSKTPEIENLLEGKTVSANSREKRLVGKSLAGGAFMAPELSWDGKTLYFSHCASQEHCWKWTPDTTWNLFRLNLENGELRQLTDSAFNDFDPCELPDGRIAFISERRGGFIRCFAESAQLRVTTAVLHSMKSDGSDLYPLSFFETSEWQPSVDHQGMLTYTRWDYTDRENCLGSAFWTCFPDGRNPRAPHGNYPQPWHTFSDNSFEDTRFGKTAVSALPMTEMQIRAIPDSHRYVFLAAPHHGETYGSICVLDLRKTDDHHMNQIRRVTPYAPFPESECPGRSQYRYGAPWPLSESFFLCNSWEDLVLLDRFGNEELICERELLPIGYDPRLRLSDPIPLGARPRPPIIARQTRQGEDFAKEEVSPNAVLGIVNANLSDQPLPKDRPIRYLRVFQVIPKPNPWMNQPNIGFGPENTPRVPLGIVPVESDGSVLLEVPWGKQLLFQVLDEKFQAIQTMRAVTYLHPGERLVCVGCHEPTAESVKYSLSQPKAFASPASQLQPECGFEEPINFYRLIQPITEKNCVPCHERENVSFQRMTHEDFRPYVFFFEGGMRGALTTPIHGGSRSIPGRSGASASRLTEILRDENHRTSVSEEDRHRFTLWLDANAPRLGAFRDEDAQKRGELVWPILDSDGGEKK